MKSLSILSVDVGISSADDTIGIGGMITIMLEQTRSIISNKDPHIPKYVLGELQLFLFLI
jgi:hypothetical protein